MPISILPLNSPKRYGYLPVTVDTSDQFVVSLGKILVMISSFLQHFININMEQSSLLVRRSYLRSYDEAIRFVSLYISNPRNHRMKYLSELTSRAG